MPRLTTRRVWRAATRGVRRGAALLLLAAPAVPAAAGAQRPEATLAVRDGARWVSWWRADAAPVRWTGPGALAQAAVWRTTAPGVETAELVLAGAGEAWRTRLVLVRLDPAQVALRLAVNREPGGDARGWTIADAPDDALLALNAGQFTREGPWGWVVHEGEELRAPGRGPLAAALVVDSAGRARLVADDSVAAVRRAGGVRAAFQSYPVVLAGDGDVPPALRTPGRGVDLAHRDARLGVGELRDGRLVVALTRFEALGGLLDAVPFGLTTPEMAAVMGALGCRRAMLLDGGISGQLAVRGAGEPRRWRGLRDVPIGLVAVPR